MLRYKKILLVAIFWNTLENVNFFGFHAVFLITARANHHKTAVVDWDHSQEQDVGGPKVLPGVAKWFPG